MEGKSQSLGGKSTSTRVSKRLELGQSSSSSVALTKRETTETTLETKGETAPETKGETYCLEYGCKMQYRKKKSYFGAIAFDQHLGVVPHGNGEMTKGSDAKKKYDPESWNGGRRYYLGFNIRCRQHAGPGFSCMCHFCVHRDYEGLPLSRRRKVCLSAKGRTLNIKKTRRHRQIVCSSKCVYKHNEILDGEDIKTVDDSRFVEYDGKITTIFCGGRTYKNTEDQPNVFHLEGLAEHHDVPISFTLGWKLECHGLPL